MRDGALMTEAEAAAYMKLSRQTLRKLRQRGLLRYVPLDKKGRRPRIRYRQADLDAWAAARATTGAR